MNKKKQIKKLKKENIKLLKALAKMEKNIINKNKNIDSIADFLSKNFDIDEKDGLLYNYSQNYKDKHDENIYNDKCYRHNNIGFKIK